MRGPEVVPLLLWCEQCGAAFSEGVAFVHRYSGGLRCPSCAQGPPQLRLVVGGRQ